MNAYQDIIRFLFGDEGFTQASALVSGVNALTLALVFAPLVLALLTRSWIIVAMVAAALAYLLFTSSDLAGLPVAAATPGALLIVISVLITYGLSKRQGARMSERVLERLNEMEQRIDGFLDALDRRTMAIASAIKPEQDEPAASQDNVGVALMPGQPRPRET